MSSLILALPLELDLSSLVKSIRFSQFSKKGANSQDLIQN